MASVFSDVLGPSPDIRQYLRRCLLDETPAGTTIFDEMVVATQRGLELLGRAGGIAGPTPIPNGAPSRSWRSCSVRC